MWLNEKTAWIYPHLRMAQTRMTELAQRYPAADPLLTRALRQSARELLLAQSSDWPFILRTGTSPDYARQRLESHLRRFSALYEQIRANHIDEPALRRVEGLDNLFPQIEYRYWH
jgi:1,4-alpha-glucan branching enzyme